MSADGSLWQFAWTVYAVGILSLGIVLVCLAIIFLRLLPGALQVGRQLAKSISRHARVLERDADAAEAIHRVEHKVSQVCDKVGSIEAQLAKK